MPKVSKFEFLLDGKRTTADISYSRNEKFHTRNFPKQVLDVASGRFEDIKVGGYETEKELLTILGDALTLYHEKKKTSRKVIIYRFTASRNIRFDPAGNERSGMEKVGDINAEGHAFGISYFLAIEVNHNGLQYHHIDEDGNTTWQYGDLDKDENVIEWTAQRERSLIEIGASMEKLAMKIAGVLTDTTRTIELLESPKIKLID